MGHENLAHSCGRCGAPAPLQLTHVDGDLGVLYEPPSACLVRARVCVFSSRTKDANFSFRSPVSLKLLSWRGCLFIL